MNPEAREEYERLMRDQPKYIPMKPEQLQNYHPKNVKSKRTL